MTNSILEAVNRRLFLSTDLTDIVGNHIYEAFGPPNAEWPLVHYFDVATVPGYQLDYNAVTVQISCYSQSIEESKNIREIIYRLFNRFNGTINTYYGDVDINYTETIDSGIIESDDPYLYGYQSRFLIRYRGENIGG